MCQALDLVDVVRRYKLASTGVSEISDCSVTRDLLLREAEVAVLPLGILRKTWVWLIVDPRLNANLVHAKRNFRNRCISR